jgi:polysaccharide biosynthesis protein PelE
VSAAEPDTRPARRGIVAWGVVLAGVALQVAGVVLAARGVADPSVGALAGQPVSAFASAAAARANTGVLLACVALEALAAGLVALGCARLLAARGQTVGRGGLALLWGLNLALPVGGVVCTLGARALAAVLPGNGARLPIVRVDEPAFTESRAGSVSYGRGARLKAELRNAEAGVDFRMTALLAMQALPARTVSPVLQEMLADPLDDIRLLAYGSLENKEKALTQKILAERARRAASAALPASERARIDKALAELYSELVYQQLVTGDVHDHAIEQADYFAISALTLTPYDAALWRLRGRLALARRDLDAADALLGRAIACGFPRERLLPYLAESAYWRRDFAGVRRLLGELDRRTVAPMLQATLDCWMSVSLPDRP